LAPLQGPELARGLAAVAPELPEERRALLAELAEGSIGRALELAAAGWLDRYAELVKGLAEARGSLAARVTLAGSLARGNDGGGFRATAELLGFALRRLAVLQAGRSPARELFAGELAALHGLAAGRGLDQWVALWDKLTALSGRVDQLNLDPVQAALQVVHAICGGAPDIELSIA
jgi:DNA polymerase III subunit delta'